MRDEVLRRLHSTAVVAVLVGAAGSVGFLLYAGRNSPQRLLMVAMAAWVLAPFIGLLLADVISTRWSAMTRQALYAVMLAVTVCSLAVYWNELVHARKAQAAFVFVLVPVVSGMVIGVVLTIAASVSRRNVR